MNSPTFSPPANLLSEMPTLEIIRGIESKRLAFAPGFAELNRRDDIKFELVAPRNGVFYGKYRNILMRVKHKEKIMQTFDLNDVLCAEQIHAYYFLKQNFKKQRRETSALEDIKVKIHLYLLNNVSIEDIVQLLKIGNSFYWQKIGTNYYFIERGTHYWEATILKIDVVTANISLTHSFGFEKICDEIAVLEPEIARAVLKLVSKEPIAYSHTQTWHLFSDPQTPNQNHIIIDNKTTDSITEYFLPHDQKSFFNDMLVSKDLSPFFEANSGVKIETIERAMLFKRGVYTIENDSRTYHFSVDNTLHTVHIENKEATYTVISWKEMIDTNQNQLMELMLDDKHRVLWTSNAEELNPFDYAAQKGNLDALKIMINGPAPFANIEICLNDDNEPTYKRIRGIPLPELFEKNSINVEFLGIKLYEEKERSFRDTSFATLLNATPRSVRFSTDRIMVPYFSPRDGAKNIPLRGDESPFSTVSTSPRSVPSPQTTSSTPTLFAPSPAPVSVSASPPPVSLIESPTAAFPLTQAVAQSIFSTRKK